MSTSFHSLKGIFLRAEFIFILIKTDLSVFTFIDPAFGNLSRKSWRFSPFLMFCSRSFIVEVLFTFRPVIHFELLFTYHAKYRWKSISVIWISNFPSSIYWKDYPFSIKLILYLYQNSLVFQLLYIYKRLHFHVWKIFAGYRILG